MKTFVYSLGFALVAFASALHAQVSPPIYQTDSIVVTLQDFNDYLVARDITEEHRAQALSKPGAIRQIADSIFLIKAMNARAAVNSAIDRAAIEASVADHRMRLLMRAQLDLDIEGELKNTDWDALALDEYRASPEKHQTPETVRASHILISSTERSAEELEERVSEVMEALANGGSFDELAKELSDDPGSAAKGGDLGYFARGRMVKEFEDAAFSLAVNEVSAPVSSQFGTHIILVTGKNEAGLVPFDKAKPQIIEGLKRKQASAAREEVFNRVKTEATRSGLAVNEELLKELETSYGVPQEPEMPKVP